MEITHVILASLFILGIWKAADRGMILEKFDYWAADNLPDILYKPLIGCAICMSSLYGSAYYFVMIGIDWHVLIFIPSVAGCSFLISRVFDILEIRKLKQK